MACRHEHFHTPWFDRWSHEMMGYPDDPGRHHRKLWEWSAIAQAFHERGMLEPGKRGMGFAVGTEPIVSLFAKYGATILATDHAGSIAPEMWKGNHQWADGQVEALHKEHLLDRTTFLERVSYRDVDMRDLSGLDHQSVDFLWSSCSFEHLGNLALGLDFVVASSRLLKPGGVAVHTTEFNVLSDEHTLAEGPSVIYRTRDMIEVAARLEAEGFEVEPFDFDTGTDAEDVLFDFPPFYEQGRHHVKLLLDGFIATSFAIVIKRPAATNP